MDIAKIVLPALWLHRVSADIFGVTVQILSPRPACSFGLWASTPVPTKFATFGGREITIKRSMCYGASEAPKSHSEPWETANIVDFDLRVKRYPLFARTFKPSSVAALRVGDSSARSDGTIRTRQREQER